MSDSSSSSAYVPSTTHSSSSALINHKPWVPLILPKSILLETTSKLITLNLLHPKTNVATLFLLHTTQENQLALLALEEMKLNTSCIYENRIISNASSLIVLPMDPLFLLLPMAESKASKHFISLDTLLHSPVTPDSALLATLPGLETKLERICETKEMVNLSVFHFSKEKTLKFLSTKLSNLAKYFCRKVDPSAEVDKIPTEYFWKALDYFEEWVSEPWLRLVKKEFQLTTRKPTADPLSVLLQKNIFTQKRCNPGIQPNAKKPKQSTVPFKRVSVSKNQSTLSAFFKK